MESIIYLIYDMDAELSRQSILIINEKTELNFQTNNLADDYVPITYQILIDARKESLGMGEGYPRYKDGVLIYVLPCPPMGLIVEPNNGVVLELTKEVFERDYLPTLDEEIL